MKAAPKRLTRQEAQQETQNRLIEAALELIAEAGVGAASIRGICARAGYSQGAFYSNFSSKDELVLELVRRHLPTIVHSLKQPVETEAQTTLSESLHQVEAHLEDLAQNPILSRLIIEMHLHAQRDPEFSERFAEVTKGYHADFTQLIEALAARHGLELRQSASDIAETMVAIWFGVIVQQRGDETGCVAQIQMAYFRALIV